MDPNVRDSLFFDKLGEILDIDPQKVKFISENFNSFTMRRHTNQNYAYYDIFKKIENVPGSIAEFGVYWGNGMFNWLGLMETFLPLDRGRKVFGFDDFKGYKRQLELNDEKGVEYIKHLRGDFTVDISLIETLVEIKNSDNLVPNDKRCIIYNGDVTETFQQFEIENPGVRLSLALVDVNLQSPTKFIIDNCWRLMPPGGIMVFRGYGSKPWEGEAVAVDEFLDEQAINKLETITYNNTPGAFITKGM